jgi:hypothetical protein
VNASGGAIHPGAGEASAVGEFMDVSGTRAAGRPVESRRLTGPASSRNSRSLRTTLTPSMAVVRELRSLRDIEHQNLNLLAPDGDSHVSP